MGTDGQIKISVIMPVYNRAKVLPKAVGSVLSQTLQDIELLCINDGSTDNSVMVLKKLAQNDSRLKILSQRNAGAGPARNYGLKRAKGEFVAFLDSDDWYASDDALEKLYKSAVAHDVRICLGGRRDAKRGKLQPLDQPGKVYFTKEALIDYRDYQFPHGYYRGIYKRHMLLENHICFPPYRRYQDPPFFVNAMICAGSFYAIQDIVLIYDASDNYQEIHWDERKLTDLLKGIRDVLRMAKEQHYVGMQMELIERICFGDWSEILSKNLHGSFMEAKLVMEEANDYFLDDALRQYRFTDNEKPFDPILENTFSNNRGFLNFLKRMMLCTQKILSLTSRK